MPQIGIRSSVLSSPVISGSSLRADTIAYRDRVVADGGEVVDLNYVNTWYATLEAQGLDTETGFIGGPNMGVKKSGGSIETFYNLIDAANDATQGTGTNQGTDGTDVNAGARVSVGDGADDHYDLASSFTISAGDGLIMWWQIVNKPVAGYWAGTTSSSQHGVRVIDTEIRIRATGTYSVFSIPTTDRPEVDTMRCTSIVRHTTDQDSGYLQGVKVGSDATNAGGFLVDALFDGVSAHFDSSIATMVLLQSTVTTTQREALEAVGNTKNLLPNLFKQSGEFCIVTIPDIQKDIELGSGVNTQAQVDWIKDNATAQNIKAVVFIGDQVQDGGDSAQQQRAKGVIDTILPTIPTLWVYGNHDDDNESLGGDPPGRYSTEFNAEFGTTELSTQSWWNGGFEDAFSSAAYYLFSEGGTDYIVVTLPFGPSQDEIDWVNTLIGTTYSSRTAFLFTHSYLDDAGEVSGTGGNDADIYDLGADVHVGTQIKAEVSDLRSNLRIIYNGHHQAATLYGSHRQSFVVSSENQHAIYQNFQNKTNNGDGFFMLTYINPSTNTARCVTYSPKTLSFKPDSEWPHKFGLEL